MQNLKSIKKINETSSMSVYHARNEQDVRSILRKLGLESKHFAVIVNGKKVSPDFIVQEGDEIVILPKIAGG